MAFTKRSQWIKEIIAFMKGNDRGVLLNRKKGGILTDQALQYGMGSGVVVDIMTN